MDQDIDAGLEEPCVEECTKEQMVWDRAAFFRKPEGYPLVGGVVVGREEWLLNRVKLLQF